MARDPADRTDEEAHDVLAAEAFAVPAPDPRLRHGPVDVPEDPSGIAEPHDILAAEEFAMPAGRPAPASETRRGAEVSRWAAAAAVGGRLLALLRLRRRR